MTLQASGAISLSDLQTEFGGSNPISLSEYYSASGTVTRKAGSYNNNIPTSGAVSLSNFYDTTAYLDIQTITVGQDVGGNKFTSWWLEGYTGSVGSISDGTSDIYSSAISGLYYDVYNTQLVLYLNGSFSNSGWTSLYIDNNGAYSRASATYSSGVTKWVWTLGSNPFPAAGNTSYARFV